MNSLCLESKANPTGLKHREGQFPLFGLLMTLIAAVVEVEGSVGMPVAGSKLILLSRYPSGGLRSQEPWNVIYAAVALALNLTSSGAVWAGKHNLGA